MSCAGPAGIAMSKSFKCVDLLASNFVHTLCKRVRENDSQLSVSD